MPRPADTAIREFFEAARAEHARAAVAHGYSRVELRGGDRRVQLVYAGEALAAAHRPALRAVLTPPSDGPPTRTVLLYLEHEVPGGCAPVPWRAEQVGPRGLVEVPGAPAVVYEYPAGAVTMFDAEQALLIHRVPAVDALPWWEFAAPLRPALFFSLNAPGQLLVHGAAVGDEARGGVLLGGVGGSGKSTTALAALAAGLAYVADDYLLLVTKPEPVAHNLYSTAKLDESHLARFPGLACGRALPVPEDPDRKAVLALSDVCTQLPIRAVVIPRVRGGRSRLRPASPGAALLALAPSTALQMPYDGGAPLAELREVVQRRPCWFLEVGDDPAELAPLIEGVLDEVAVAA